MIVVPVDLNSVVATFLADTVGVGNSDDAAVAVNVVVAVATSHAFVADIVQKQFIFTQ